MRHTPWSCTFVVSIAATMVLLGGCTASDMSGPDRDPRQGPAACTNLPEEMWARPVDDNATDLVVRGAAGSWLVVAGAASVKDIKIVFDVNVTTNGTAMILGPAIMSATTMEFGTLTVYEGHAAKSGTVFRSASSGATSLTGWLLVVGATDPWQGTIQLGEDASPLGCQGLQGGSGLVLASATSGPAGDMELTVAGGTGLAFAALPIETQSNSQEGGLQAYELHIGDESVIRGAGLATPVGTTVSGASRVTAVGATGELLPSVTARFHMEPPPAGGMLHGFFAPIDATSLPFDVPPTFCVSECFNPLRLS